MTSGNRDRLTSPQLKIYVYLLESGKPCTVREIASALGMPVSSVHYNLKKLVALGIVERTPEGFTVSQRINIEGFVFIRNKMIPRLILYSFFFIGVFLGELVTILLQEGYNVDKILILIISLVSSVLFFYEGIRAKASLL